MKDLFDGCSMNFRGLKHEFFRDCLLHRGMFGLTREIKILEMASDVPVSGENACMP